MESIPDFDTLEDLQKSWYNNTSPMPQEPAFGFKLQLCQFPRCEEKATHVAVRLLFFVQFSMWLLGLHCKGPIQVTEEVYLCRKHLQEQTR